MNISHLHSPNSNAHPSHHKANSNPEQEKKIIMDRPRTMPAFSSSEDIQPPSEWVRDDKFETIVVKLAGFGFRKEQVKVQIDNYRNLRTSGERPIDGGRWIRFRKDFVIPHSLDISQIRAKFENGNLYVVMPKLIMTQAETQVPRHPQEPVSAGTKPEAQLDTTQKAATGMVAKPESQLDTTQKTTNGKVRKPETQLDTTQKAATGTVPKPESQLDTAQKTTNGKARTPEAQPDTTQKATSRREDTKPEETPLEKEKEKGKATFEEPMGTGKGEEVDNWKEGKATATKEKVSGGVIGARIGKWPEKAKAGVGGMVQGLRKSPRQLLVNIGVSFMVLVTLGLYMTYKLRKATVEENN